MSPDREVSIGELADDLADLAAAVRGLETGISQAIKDLTIEIKRDYVPRELYDVKHDALVALVDSNNKRLEVAIAEVEGRQTWIGRAAVTALLLPVLSLLIGAIILGAFK